VSDERRTVMTSYTRQAVSKLIQNLWIRGWPIESDTVGASERVCVFGGIGFSSIVCSRAAAAAPVES